MKQRSFRPHPRASGPPLSPRAHRQRNSTEADIAVIQWYWLFMGCKMHPASDFALPRRKTGRRQRHWCASHRPARCAACFGAPTRWPGFRASRCIRPCNQRLPRFDRQLVHRGVRTAASQHSSVPQQTASSLKRRCLHLTDFVIVIVHDVTCGPFLCVHRRSARASTPGKPADQNSFGVV